MPFFVPDGWEQYHRQIKSSIDTLIRQNVLAGISLSDLSCWYGNFNTPEEKYLAAHLLDSLVYRSDAMLKASCRHIAKKMLPQVLNLRGLVTVKDYSDFFSLPHKNPPVVFSTIPDKKPAKSGDTVLRVLLRENSIHSSFVKHAPEWRSYNSKIESLIIIDDIVGTGDQFKKFYISNELHNCKLKILYFPLFAHVDGLKNISSACPSVEVHPVEVLSEEHNFFREDKDMLGHGIWAKDQNNRVADVKDFYIEMLDKKGINIQNPFGYGELGLTIYTSVSSPNNSLHSFYTEKNTQNWAPLLKR